MLGAGKNEATRKAVEASENVPKRIPVVTVEIWERQRAGEKLMNFAFCADVRKVDERFGAAFRVGVELRVAH